MRCGFAAFLLSSLLVASRALNSEQHHQTLLGRGTEGGVELAGELEGRRQQEEEEDEELEGSGVFCRIEEVKECDAVLFDFCIELFSTGPRRSDVTLAGYFNRCTWCLLLSSFSSCPSLSHSCRLFFCSRLLETWLKYAQGVGAAIICVGCDNSEAGDFVIKAARLHRDQQNQSQLLPNTEHWKTGQKMTTAITTQWAKGVLPNRAARRNIINLFRQHLTEVLDRFFSCPCVPPSSGALFS